MKLRLFLCDGSKRDIELSLFGIVIGAKNGFESDEEFIDAKTISKIGFFRDGFSMLMFDMIEAMFFERKTDWIVIEKKEGGFDI